MKYKIVLLLIFCIVVLVIVKSNMFNNKLDSLEYPNIGKENISSLEEHNYEWEYLTDIDGKKQYIDKNGVKALMGIDVSTYQGDIDWEQVKQDNIDFAVIRLGNRGYRSGEISLDKNYSNNIEKASQAGIDIGVYFFSQAISIKESEEEAEFILDNIKDYDIELPIVFDMERVEDGRTNNLTRKEKTIVALAFCEKIEEAGFVPMIYGSSSYLKNAVLLPDIMKYDIWIADYADEPSFPYEFQIWQYTDEGKVKGITGNVDLNLYF
ncbi:hypothetical protein SH1V18_01060 [Vallitalea longa]|uniref:Lysozyme n=1 Tax=Vallitalea longa TaxID=2936439 RepID=A0A9W5Y880_9FIRM|nr:glycoside hydrolase family 25 protein [Vallitalea longa]GKX27626.1 hypothetical protein SH1V18_01060 [Vallitalea longa]